jgi:hypothetical protein
MTHKAKYFIANNAILTKRQQNRNKKVLETRIGEREREIELFEILILNSTCAQLN